ncbi:unnamed protein product, partial [Brassica rapa]
KDYADILEFLVGRWKIESLKGLSGEGNKAQDYLCGLSPRIRRLYERAQGRAKKGAKVPFSWIHDREAQIQSLGPNQLDTAMGGGGSYRLYQQ